MSLNYFSPADVAVHAATYNYTTKNGSGFGILPNNEQVFFSARLVETNNLCMGDGVRVWAVDNYASPETSHFASRWRAIRVEVVSRVADIVRSTPDIAPAAAPARPAPAQPSSSDPESLMRGFLNQPRPWTVNQLSSAIAKASTIVPPDLTQRLAGRLSTMHKSGEIACLKIYAMGEQARATAVYYAKDENTFYEHLDNPIDEEDAE